MSDHPTPGGEQDHETELQRMLALKRHEAPPPRYFRGLSERVIDRLHQPESSEPPTFWSRWGLDMEGRPLLVCACGILICALLVTGLIASLRVGPPQPSRPALEDGALLILNPPPAINPLPASEDPSPVFAPAAASNVRLDAPVSVSSAAGFPALASPGTGAATEPGSPAKGPARK